VATPRDLHLVRPRWVWGGLVGTLAGAVVLSIGVVTLSALASISGAVVLLLGAACSLHGGVLDDAVSTLSPRRELRQVRDGEVHPGVAAGEMVDTPPARHDAVASNRRTRELGRAAHHPGPVAWAPVAGWTCLLITAILVVSQWNLVAHDAAGASNSFRDTGCAILLGVSGLRVAVATSRQLIASGGVLVAGLALVLGAVLAEHHHRGLQLVEVASGCLAVVCALVAYLWPSTPA
jgi:hypothetical protein